MTEEYSFYWDAEEVKLPVVSWRDRESDYETLELSQIDRMGDEIKEWRELCRATTQAAANKAAEEGGLPALLQEILNLAESGMCHGLTADDYCSQIVAKIKGATGDEFSDSRDAARYRWLRDPVRGMANLACALDDSPECPYFELKSGIDLDTAIDASMQVPVDRASRQDHAPSILRDMLVIQEVCGLHTDEYAPGSVIEYIKELEAESASRQVANKAEVEQGIASAAIWDAITRLERTDSTQDERFAAADALRTLATPPATTGASTARDQALEEAARICDGVNNHDNPMTAGDCADSIRALKGSVGASTVLTDERIDDPWVDLQWKDTLNNIRKDFDEAFPVEVAAQAGQVALPSKFANLKFVVDEYVKEDSKESDWSNEKLNRLQGEITQEADPRLLQELLSMLAAPSPAKESK